MTKRARLSVLAAALGVACIALSPLARADTTAPIDIYDSISVAQGVVGTFSLRPNILDPLAQAGTLYSESHLSSQGGGASNSIAAQVFPGKFGIGAVGCAGLKGWVQATYPPAGGCTAEQEDTLFSSGRSSLGQGLGQPVIDDVINTFQDRARANSGRMYANAHFGDGSATVTTNRFTLFGDLAAPPVVDVAQVSVDSKGTRTDTGIVQTARATLHGVSLLGGGITIDTIVADARATTNGTTATANATLTFTGARAIINGASHDIAIDTSGVHVRDPDASREQNASLDEDLQDGLLKAGIRIRIGTPTEIVDGAQGDASTGGLTIAFEGAIPTFRVPAELAPALALVFNRIPTQCLNDFGAPLPLCFGQGVVPGSGTQFPFSLAVGTASASTLGASNPEFTFGPAPREEQSPTTIGPSISAPGGPPLVGPPTNPGPVATAQPLQVRGVLTGLVARLPSGALAFAGGAFIILAVGAALGPSLRHARP